MATWHDVLSLCTHDPGIAILATASDGTALASLAVTTAHGQAHLVVENTAHPHWLQIYAPISDTATAEIWAVLAPLLATSPAIGLTQLPEGISIRHAILLDHADVRCISKGITVVAAAVTTLFASLGSLP